MLTREWTSYVENGILHIAGVQTVYFSQIKVPELTITKLSFAS